MPAGVSVDGAGNIVISGTCLTSTRFDPLGRDAISPDCLRVVAVKAGRFYGKSMKRGDIYGISGFDGSHFGDGGPASHAEFDAGAFISPVGFATDAAGNLAIGDNGDFRARFVPAISGRLFGQAMAAGDIYTIAGNGQLGYSGDRSRGTSAKISFPGGLAFDSAGNLLIADPINFTLRVVAVRSGTFYGQTMTGGDIYTIAGDGETGHSGDGGPALDAKLNKPGGVTMDSHGNLLIADGNAIRVIAGSTSTFYGQAMTAGDIYHLASVAAESVAVDAMGNVIASEGFDVNRTELIAQTSGTFYGKAVTAGKTYVIAGGNLDVGVQAPTGVPATSSFVGPGGIALDSAGNLVLADDFFDVIRVVARTSGTFYGVAMVAGDIYTIAGRGVDGLGDGGPASDARFTGVGVAVQPSGAIDVETRSAVRQISG